jgi:hypothetical protein
MKKALFLCLLGLLLSCIGRKENEPVAASGNLNTISVIIDDQLWNGEIGDSIRNKFAAPVTGLPQEEPLFDINQYPLRLLEGFMTNSRNIILVKKERAAKFKIVSDEYAKPQNVFHISGATVPEILDILEKNTPEMIRKMHNTEILEAQKSIDTSLLDVSRLNKKFGISLHVPSTYEYALQRTNFTWLKKEMVSGNMSLLIYSVPAKCLDKNNDAIRNIMTMRDSIGDLYIHGRMPASRMITEEAYAPYLLQTKIEGRKAYETKGTWELIDDYMSGPFINYAINDKRNKRILVIEGFCYAPSKDKRDLMLELEAIVKSVKFVNPKTGTAKTKRNAAKMEN